MNGGKMLQRKQTSESTIEQNFNERIDRNDKYEKAKSEQRVSFIQNWLFETA